MLTEQGIYIGLAGEERVILPLNMANRHGLITGASGTGKTVTMKVLAEDFSDAGVPVFLCDVKGDVSGLAVPGTPSEKMDARIEKFGIREQFSYTSYPVVFWDVFQEEGHPVRATVSDMGPDLLSRLLRLTAAQEGVLNLVFRIADDHGLLLIDLKDLRTTLQFVADNRTAFSAEYGAIAPVTLQGILRALTPLETQGGDLFFGEPALDILDWMGTDRDGRGLVNLLDCVKLCRSPGLYAAFLLWMLSELFERLPEAGDLDKPKLVFFFDEAHMLFRDAPKVLVEKIEQLVRLIRSKGVGVYFVTQSPGDLPDTVLAQLSHRVQHALRAYTPAEQKVLRAAASSLRPNPAFQTEEVIRALGVGEALVSVLDENGVPGMVQRASILCPRSLMAPADGLTRNASMASDGMEKYDISVDNVSAYETLQERKTAADQAAAIEAERAALEREQAALDARRAKEEEAERKRQEREAEAERKRQEREAETERRKQEREAEAERRKQEREEEAARRKQEREEEYERRKQEREEEAARRKQERDEALLRRKLEQEQAALDRKLEQERKRKEQEQRRKEAAADRRRAQIENTLISTGGQVLRRGLMNTLYGKK